MSSKSQRPRPVGAHYDGDLRAALVAAAAEALADGGPDRLSLREVARRCGVSHAAPAHYFGDKAGLLTAVATVGFDRFTAHLAEAVLTGPTDPVELLAVMGTAYARFAETEPGYFAVMFDPGVIDGGDADYARASDAAFEALRATIDGLQAAGWRRRQDSTDLAAAVWALAHGFTVLLRQGSLARHRPGASPDTSRALVDALLAPK